MKVKELIKHLKSFDENLEVSFLKDGDYSVNGPTKEKIEIANIVLEDNSITNQECIVIA